MKYLFGFFLMLAAAQVFAQNFSISGRVVDETNNQPLEYANVVMYQNSDSAMVKGSVTNSLGEFTIEKIKAGKYFVKAQFLGYEISKSQVCDLTKEHKLNVGTIALSPSGMMVEEVNVTGARINTITKIDKQTFDAAQFESAKGGNAVDVLRNMPSVAVNAEGEILVRGTGGFLLLLDGKPVLSDPSSVLSRIPANAIKNVDLIPTP